LDVTSILSISNHLDEFVSLHALDAHIPVALGTPPACNPFRLIEASDSR